MKNVYLHNYKKVISVIIFFACFNSMASSFPHLKDPKKLLVKMDQFMENPPFHKAYTCGKKIRYEMNYCAKFCEPFTCTEVCDPRIKEYVIEIRDCRKNSATIFNATTKKEWFKATPEGQKKHSFLRYFLAAPHFGTLKKFGEEIGKNYVVLEKIVDEKFQLKNGQKLQAKRLHFTYFYYDKLQKLHIPSKQSVVMGKQVVTQGFHLEHNFEGMKKPIGKVIEIK